ncbi:unnamed protein product [Adineta ricciae]|uniref:Uncharacterized protein n=1 Tax=Adineta ricciae TaxID=249248 RepID=A0A814M0Z2_ADIRI|nr:unnamed protein product [Adineta ricciae]CAF1071560.1 unnamed protein product [Adineta ricciae]
MFSTAVINFILILACVNYSYELKFRDGYSSHQKRSVQEKLEALGGHLQRKVGQDLDDIEAEVKAEEDSTKELLKGISESIKRYADELANAGQDASCADSWRSIQRDLHKGLERIIKSYDRYIDLHRETCQYVENYAKDTINKYKEELYALDQISAPSGYDLGSSDWQSFFTRVPSMVKYADCHCKSILTAADCGRDLISNGVQYRKVILQSPPAPQSRVIQVVSSSALRANPEPWTIPCGEDSAYNGYRACSNAISDYTLKAAYDACGGCAPPTALY